MNSVASAAVCSLWRYTSAICLCLYRFCYQLTYLFTYWRWQLAVTCLDFPTAEKPCCSDWTNYWPDSTRFCCQWTPSQNADWDQRLWTHRREWRSNSDAWWSGHSRWRCTRRQPPRFGRSRSRRRTTVSEDSWIHHRNDSDLEETDLMPRKSGCWITSHYVQCRSNSDTLSK